MTTEIHEGANGSLKKAEVEPLGELKGKEELHKPVDLCNAGDVNGKSDKCGREVPAEKEEPVAKSATPKQKGILDDGGEAASEPQDGGNDYSSEEEEGDGEGEEDAREAEDGPYEDEDEEEYVDDGEDDEGDEDESEPPSKRRK